MGVSTPRAAAVADATTGLAIDRHMPKGTMFTIGLLSKMLPAGGPCAMTRLMGSTFRGEGVNPMLHLSIEPLTNGLDTFGRYSELSEGASPPKGGVCRCEARG
jgi:hypothetical protein